LNTVCWVA
jgi:arylamine N-acetyltransferase